MKMHLYRSDISSWCGRDLKGLLSRYTVDRKHMTRNRNEATCKTCLKADAAEQRKEDAASGQ